MKPLKDYAPFKIGERFEDHAGDVLEIVSDAEYHWIKICGNEISIRDMPYGINHCVGVFKPLDRTSEALDELAQLDADEICGHKPWRDMTDDEKAPILLAWADGKSIEWWDEEIGSWCGIHAGPQTWRNGIYRIAPEERESVCIMGRGRKWRHSWVDDATHKITFDTINGEPVLDSIKMDRVK